MKNYKKTYIEVTKKINIEQNLMHMNVFKSVKFIIIMITKQSLKNTLYVSVVVTKIKHLKIEKRKLVFE